MRAEPNTLAVAVAVALAVLVAITAMSLPLHHTPAVALFKLDMLSVIAAQGDPIFASVTVGRAPFPHIMSYGKIFFSVDVFTAIGFR
jgi:hypothetical protein